MKEKYDVVIVGTGVAGCFAALHLSENMDVLMITKGDLEESDSFLPIQAHLPGMTTKKRKA